MSSPKLNKAVQASHSWYAGRRQPPLEALLDSIVNFFTHESSDSCKNWGTKAEKVVTYLEWLAFDDDQIQLHIAPPVTRALFNEVLKKATVQVLSEELEHIKPTVVAAPWSRTTTTTTIPLRSTRLDWMITGKDQTYRPALTGQQQQTLLLPKPVQPRPPTQVNSMLIDQPENARFHYTLLEDEQYWWRSLFTSDPDNAPPPPGIEDPTEVGNLAKIEDETFNAFFSVLSGAWTATNPKLGWAAFVQSVKPAENIAQNWAQERGIRRAVFQLALRAVSDRPSMLTAPPSSSSFKLPTRHRIIFPVPAATLRKAREAADVPAWIMPCVPECHATARARARARALAGAEAGSGSEEEATKAGPRETFETMRSVILPVNLVLGAPIVWRGVTRQMQEAERLRTQCQTVAKLLQAAQDRAPRPLLRDVLGLVKRGVEGAFVDESLPFGVQLAMDEWVGGDVGDRRPKMLDGGDLEWLRFLAGEGANEKNRTGRFVLDEPRERYRLFLLFASKVQKLLDDKNPEGLFARHDAQVKVEDLLAAINAGKDSNNTVDKYQFSPAEACAWLDRMRVTGHVKFRLDLRCYGVVERPPVQYFPEHRVTWNPKGTKYTRPKFSPKFISEWTNLKDHVPDVSKGSPIHNLFVALAYRLGYTIAIADKTAQGLPTSRRSRSTSSHPIPTTLEPFLSQITRLRADIIRDLHNNKTMLGPGRRVTYIDRQGQYRTFFARDHSWDWASPKILGGTGAAAETVEGPSAGHRRRQFWSLDRWPGPAVEGSSSREGMGGLRRLTEEEMKQADPIAARYRQPKLRPYVEEKVVFRPGPATYWGGDTKLQREVLFGDTMAILGGEEENQPNWLKTLTALNPFSQKLEENKLPTVDPDLVPQSWDPVAEAEEQMRAEEPEYYEEEDSDVVEEREEGDIEYPGEDVLMTGMEPLLMV
ncbi:uncharacterized protein C8A04DRAFT_8804 [Dichotomopilus funicola]|uniref:Uncharacterized protein n=1 Tax=Dichotomopilus funicola TaxID=1934379 RepID=A0AAN6ZRW2_9PEZI|nr:hypothetical protein C8A04DRAFT_8804 [Dichotomopilus funicola]